MDIVHPHGCGLDVHKRTVVACRLTPGVDGTPVKALRTFGTMTDDLEALAQWLAEAGVTHVAMESTGVYWHPVWNVLEDRFTLLLVNAHHIKQVPGRKTDVKDSEWLAELLRHGLLRGSVVPDREARELRELTRLRTSLVRDRVDVINRIQKTLEGANIKLSAVASNVVGVSGREILAALVGGTADPALMAELARGRLRAKIPALERALTGSFRPHHRFMITELLAQLDFLDERVEALNQEVARRQAAVAPDIERLDAIPGVARRTAETVLSELGIDLTHFPSAGHLVSWVGICPGQHESAGKRGSGRIRKGNAALRTVLVEAAHAAGRTQTYLGAQYRRLARRRGVKKAAVAVAHSILVIIYHMLTRNTTYEDLGVDYFERLDAAGRERRLVHQIEALGYTVTKPEAA